MLGMGIGIGAWMDKQIECERCIKEFGVATRSFVMCIANMKRIAERMMNPPNDMSMKALEKEVGLIAIFKDLKDRSLYLLCCMQSELRQIRRVRKDYALELTGVCLRELEEWADKEFDFGCLKGVGKDKIVRALQVARLLTVKQATKQEYSDAVCRIIEAVFNGFIVGMSENIIKPRPYTSRDAKFYIWELGSVVQDVQVWMEKHGERCACGCGNAGWKKLYSDLKTSVTSTQDVGVWMMEIMGNLEWIEASIVYRCLSVFMIDVCIDCDFANHEQEMDPLCDRVNWNAYSHSNTRGVRAGIRRMVERAQILCGDVRPV